MCRFFHERSSTVLYRLKIHDSEFVVETYWQTFTCYCDADANTLDKQIHYSLKWKTISNPLALKALYAILVNVNYRNHRLLETESFEKYKIFPLSIDCLRVSL